MILVQRLYILIFISFLFLTACNSPKTDNSLYIPIKFPNGLWGFVDENMKTLIEPRFDTALSFNKTFAICSFRENNHKFSALVDKAGKIVLQYENTKIEYLSGNFYLLKYPDKTISIIDYTGKVFLKRNAYTIVRLYSDYYETGRCYGFKITAGEGKYYYIFNAKNEILHELSWNIIYVPHGESYVYRTENGLGLIDSNFNIVLTGDCEQICNYPEFLEDSLNSNYIIYIKNHKEGLIKTNGSQVLKCENDFVLYPIEAYVFFAKNNKFGLADTMGNMILEPIYNSISNIDLKLIAGVGKPSVDYISRRNKIYWVDNIHEDILAKLIKVQVGANSKIYDLNKRRMLEPIYEEIKSTGQGFITCKKENKWGVVDKGGMVVVPFRYDKISEFSDSICFGERNSKIYRININQKENDEPLIKSRDFNFDEDNLYYKLIPTDNKLFHYVNGYSIIKTNKNYGIIDLSGNYVAPPIYSRILRLSSFKYPIYQLYSENGEAKIFFPAKRQTYCGDFNYISDLFTNNPDRFQSFLIKINNWGFVADNGNLNISIKRDNKFAFVNLKNLYGLLDLEKIEFAIPMKYNKIERINSNLSYFAQDKKIGIINSDNKIVWGPY